MLCSVVSHQALVMMLSYRSFFFASSNIDPGPHMASFERWGGKEAPGSIAGFRLLLTAPFSLDKNRRPLQISVIFFQGC